jgi:hypothetical protein
MAEFEAPEPNSSLGDRLLAGVRNLFARVKAIENASDRTKKVVDQQGIEIEQIRAELKRLQSEIRGIKISRGQARAKNARLREQISEAKRLLPEIEKHLN